MAETRVRLQDLTTSLQDFVDRADPLKAIYEIGNETGTIILSFASTPLLKPKIRFNSSTGRFDASVDGTTYQDVVLGNNSQLHNQNTDLGTNSNSWYIGNITDTDKIINFRTASTPYPYIKWNSTTEKIVLSTDGVTETLLQSETLKFPAIVTNQTGSYQGFLLGPEDSIDGTTLPLETALNPLVDVQLQVQVIINAPTTSWIAGDTIVEWRQDPTTKVITLENQTIDPVEVRVIAKTV